MSRGPKKGANAPSRRKRAYDLPGMTPLPFPQDPIRQIENEVLRDISEEYRVLRLEQMIEKRRREIDRMREGSIDGGSLPSNADFLNMAKLMADLSPEEAQRVRSSYTFLKMAEKGGGGGMAYMPMLLNYAKQNPGASEDQMINYLKLMDSQLMKGLEIAKAMNPPPAKSDANEMVNYLKLMDSQLMKGLEIAKAMNPNPVKSETNAMDFLKLMKELVIEGVRNPVLQAIEKAQPTPGVFEQILTNPDLFSRAKEIGMFGGKREGGAGTTEMDLKIAQVTTANQLEIKKLDLEWRKSMLEKEATDSKTNALVTALAPLSAIFAGPIDQRMRQFGQQQAAAHNPAGMPPRADMPIPPAILIKCSCGYQGPLSFDGPPPAVVNCPQCGLVLNEGDLSIAGNPEERPSSDGRDMQPRVDER